LIGRPMSAPATFGWKGIMRLKESMPELLKEKKLLITATPGGLPTVSLAVICSGLNEKKGGLIFISIDRPSDVMSRLVKRHCGSDEGVVYKDMVCTGIGDLHCVNGLFAPKLLFDAFLAAGKSDGKFTVVVSNMASLSFYNSNDRIKEFMTALEKKLAEGKLERIILIMDNKEQYIYQLAKSFTEKEIDVEGC
jgi:hypothetical protein